jgi:cobalamin synthase
MSEFLILAAILVAVCTVSLILWAMSNVFCFIVSIKKTHPVWFACLVPILLLTGFFHIAGHLLVLIDS